MQLSPFFDNLNDLSNCSLPTPHIFFLAVAALAQTAIDAISFAYYVREFYKPDEDDIRLQ